MKVEVFTKHTRQQSYELITVGNAWKYNYSNSMVTDSIMPAFTYSTWWLAALLIVHSLAMKISNSVSSQNTLQHSQFEQPHESCCVPCCVLSFTKILAGSGTGISFCTFISLVASSTYSQQLCSLDFSWILYHYTDAYVFTGTFQRC